MPPESTPLLSVRNLTVDFLSADGRTRAVAGVSFDLAAGESVALVGESGAGKSITALSIMRLISARQGTVTGEVRFKGEDVLGLDDARVRALRGREMAMIFQDPTAALNPVLTVVRQVREVYQTHLGVKRSHAEDLAVEALRSVGITDGDVRRRYPHHYSGGMRQRVMIAMAIAAGPSLLIADEPTTALDVTVQAQILELLTDLVQRRRIALLMIGHDLGVVAGMTQRVLVMYAGRIVEAAPTDELFATPRHPYTVGLLRSVPRLDRPRTDRMHAIPGSAVAAHGCAFASRCALATDRCRVETPALQEVSPVHSSACWHWPRAGWEPS